jgi:hypothetical protein
MHSNTARRGLRALAKANLVKSRQLPGKCLEVTLLEVPATDATGSIRSYFDEEKV